LVTICPKLTYIVNQYKLSGVGAGQRNEEGDNFGRVYITKCIDGDDCSNFIHSLTSMYSLYWWHKLDIEGFVKFTVCILDKFQCANATYFNLVSNVHHSPDKRRKDDDEKNNIVLSLSMAGNGIMELGKITMERKNDNWED